MTTAADRKPALHPAADWLKVYQPVISRLTKFRDCGNGRGRAECPCDHGRRGADLYLTVGEQGKLYLKCFPRGDSSVPKCGTDVILSALQLPMFMLFPDWAAVAARQEQSKARDPMSSKPADETWKLEAEYEYWDVNTEGRKFLLFAVQKKRGDRGGKNFPTKRPDPDDPSKWVWNMNGVKRILFMRPELLEDLKADRRRWVMLPEGEKDVLTARGLGFIATTNPGGTLKWQANYTEDLKGCNVIIVVDEDPVMEDPNKPGRFHCPGVDHARLVAKELLGKAAIIKVLRLPGVPPSGDLTDWKEMREAEAKKVKAPFGDREAKGELGQLLQTALTVKSEDDIAAILPRGERQWPLPEGQLPLSDYVKAPAKEKKGGETPDLKPAEEPAPAPVSPPPPPPGPPGGAMAALEKKLADLKKVAPSGPRSAAEWLGEVLMAQRGYDASLSHLTANDPKVVRDAALYLAAQIVRGLDAVPELRGGG